MFNIFLIGWYSETVGCARAEDFIIDQVGRQLLATQQNGVVGKILVNDKYYDNCIKLLVLGRKEWHPCKCL